MGIRLAILEMTRVGVVEDDDEVMVTMEEEANEAMRMMKKSWMWELLTWKGIEDGKCCSRYSNFEYRSLLSDGFEVTVLVWMRE